MKIDQFAILRKLRNRLGCDDFSAMGRKISLNPSAISRIKKNKENISARFILNAATVLDVSPKQLIKEVGLPEYYFFNKKGD